MDLYHRRTGKKYVPELPDPDTPQQGLQCRKCECRHFLVVYTRPMDGWINRRRECRNCGWRTSTREQIGR